MEFIAEEPLAIRIQGNPYAVVMRTPGDDLAHAAGFCLTEGLVDDPDDIVNLATCDTSDTNVVTVTGGDNDPDLANNTFSETTEKLDDL